VRSFEEVSNYFVYHPPTDEQRELYERLNGMWLSVAEMLWELVPPNNLGSPDKTVMFRHLADMRMQANLAVACYVEPKSDTTIKLNEGPPLNEGTLG
jgi:hypothetical protein